MRLIDADKLKNLPFERMIHTDFGDTAIPIEEIDNAQTVEITEEQAIDTLHHYGWLVVRSEHKAVERPKCVWREATRKNMFDEEVKCFECSNCHKTEIMNVIIHKKLPFCPNCGAEMGGTT